MPALPTRPRRNKIAKTNHVNDIIDYLSEQEGTGKNGSFGINPVTGWGSFFAFHGVVVTTIPTDPGPPSTTPAEFTDNRYWVQAAGPVSRGTTGDSGISFTASASTVINRARPTHFVCTNLGEPNAAAIPSHSVDKGQYVQVYGSLVKNSTGKFGIRYWFTVDRFNLFPVKLVVIPGGTNGTGTTPANYTYTVKSPGATRVIAEGQAPFIPRINGPIVTATDGMAYFEFFTGTLRLYPSERPMTTPCATP
jgi:hypothetical protein